MCILKKLFIPRAASVITHLWVYIYQIKNTYIKYNLCNSVPYLLKLRLVIQNISFNTYLSAPFHIFFSNKKN